MAAINGKDIIAENDVEIVDFGMVDSNALAFEVSKKINAENPDLIFCDMATYATSSTFTPIIQNVTAPIVLIALQPLTKLDYTKANTFMQLQNDNICSVPEFMCAAERLDKKIQDVVIGTLYNDDNAKKEITEWCDIAKVLNGLKGARIGLMGHVMEAMYDMHCDPASITSAFKVHVPLIEIDALMALIESVTEQEISEKIPMNPMGKFSLILSGNMLRRRRSLFSRPGVTGPTMLLSKNGIWTIRKCMKK